MDERLLRRYRAYASTDEALAVLFVKKHLAQAKGHWVDVVDFERYEMSTDELHFRFVQGGLFRRVLNPKYPPKSAFSLNGRFDERGYELMTRAITWETAHTDIEQQKASKIRPLKFEITGISYDRNRDNKDFFRSDAPPEIKALANNLNDRTDPLWDIAAKFTNTPEFVYEIRKVRII